MPLSIQIPYTSDETLNGLKDNRVEPTHPKDLTTETAAADDLVKGTAFDFGDFRIRKYKRENQIILEFSGTATHILSRELERIAFQCRGDVGLDLSELSGVTPSLVPILERIRKRLIAQQHCLFLCNPTSKLMDILKLGGVSDLYSIVDAVRGFVPGRAEAVPSRPDGSKPASGGGASPAAPAGATRPGEDDEARKKALVRKEITFFDRSLKRTEILEKGLDSAARCVQNLLPTQPPRIPGYRFAFAYRQSEKVGGDFFDFISLEKGRLGLSIGDMSGRGMEAAILMCLAKKVISIRALDRAESMPNPPIEVLVRANEDLHSDLGRAAFITALYAILEPEEGVLRFARAGHERPILLSPKDSADPRFIESDGVALGVMQGDRFRSRLAEGVVKLTPGSRILLYTDGLVDSQSPRGQPYSRVRLLDSMRRIRPQQSAEEIIAALMEEISRHTGGGTPDDDMTAVLIAKD